MTTREDYTNLSGTESDLEYRIAYGLDLYPDASVEDIERIATEAQRLAEEEEREGIEDNVTFAAEQSVYGCDWEWKDQEDEPTARVHDCDGNTLHEIS